MFFAKHGPIGTVKIMWPRGEEDRRGTRGLMGFVNFMKRRDAELALEANDQLDWGGTIIRVTWSKSAPKPSKPIYDITTGRIKRSPSPRIRSTRNKRRDSTSSSRSRSPKPKRRRSPSDSKGRSRKRSRSDSRGRTRRRSYSSSSYSSYSDSRSRSRSRSPPSKSDLYRDQWVAKIDKDRAEFVKGVARKIRDRGSGYAEDLRMKEKGNKKYDFLSDNTLPEYHLYRSGLSSRYRFPTPPPDPFIDDGIASVYSTDSAEESEKERTAKGHLGKLARKRFEALLRVMSGKRAEIARAMEFALVRAEAADEVAEMVCESLKLGGTPVPRKMARLHLVSDILHNSASPLPNVWKYRLAFESRLSPVFAHLCTVTQSLDAYSGRISAEVFRNQVLAVLDIWDRWMLFNQGVNDTLRDLLLGKTSLSSLTSQDTISKSGSTMGSSEPKKSEGEMKGFKSGGFKSSFKPIGSVVSVSITDTAVQMGEVEDVDGEPMDGEDVDGEPMNEEDVDGEPMNEEDVDGEPMNEEDVDGEPLNEEDVDGEAMNGSNYLRRYDLKEEEDVDGEPMEILDEEDVDGIPF
ncbi:hypothetical protein M231_03757 [Tremella mesenterica]|uniref:U2-associated protein SR140 n=1 Tax=Tremella mesenterica TaxID=5217 RepID=A0A4V1M439_TREME|nr:hypothetical protein M231_03757 [Tremella mesenterica]